MTKEMVAKFYESILQLQKEEIENLKNRIADGEILEPLSDQFRHLLKRQYILLNLVARFEIEKDCQNVQKFKEQLENNKNLLEKKYDEIDQLEVRCLEVRICINSLLAMKDEMVQVLGRNNLQL